MDMATQFSIIMISALALSSTCSNAAPLLVRKREAPSEAAALQKLRSGISVLRQISASLASPVDTTCKLLSQLEGLEQLDSIDDDVFAMRAFTEANMNDSCQWYAD